MNRSVGLLMMAGSVPEFAGGLTLSTGGGAATATGVGAAPGIPAMVAGSIVMTHAVDVGSTGWQMFWTGERQETRTYQGVLELTGSPTVAMYVDSGLSMVGPAPAASRVGSRMLGGATMGVASTGSRTVSMGLRPADFGLTTIAENPQMLRMWNDALRKSAASTRSGGNGYTQYLKALEAGTTITDDMVDAAWKTVREKFVNSARGAGHTIAEVHHWNFSKQVYPSQLFDSRNLVPAPTRAIHETIHRMTSSTTNIWKGPIGRAHALPINNVSTRLR